MKLSKIKGSSEKHQVGNWMGSEKAREIVREKKISVDLKTKLKSNGLE